MVHGGAERLLFDTSQELLARGHQVSIVFGNDDRAIPNPLSWPSAINRYYVPELHLSHSDRALWTRQRRGESHRSALRWMQDIIDLEAADLIHVHNFTSVEFFGDLKVSVPLLRTVHSYENLCRSQLKRRPDGSVCSEAVGRECESICGRPDSFRAVRVRQENRLMASAFTTIVAISTYMRDVLASNGFPPERIRLLPNFSRLIEVPVPDAAENSVLYVGRVVPEKGLLELVRAVGMIPERPTLRLVGMGSVLGQGAFQVELLEEAKRRDIRLDARGWCVGAELREAYSRAKVVAFSSVWPEPFGLVGIEAMFQEKPVVAFDVGAVRDWLQHGVTGFLVAPGDIAGYAERLRQLLTDDNLRLRMGQAARRVALDRFTPERYVSDLLDVYSEAVHESAADRSGRRAEGRDAQRRACLPLGGVACAAS